MGRLDRYFAKEPEAQSLVGVKLILAETGFLMDCYFWYLSEI